MPFITQGKTNWKFILIIIIFVVITGGGILAYQYLWLPKEEVKNSQKPIACTQEAKICPDGSFVGRTSPKCEFAECPAVKVDEFANWETYENSSMIFSIKYNPIEWEWKKYQFPEKEFSANPTLGEKALAMELDNKNSSCVVMFIKSTPFNRDTGKVLAFKDLVQSEKEGVIQNFTKEITEEKIILNEVSAVELSYIAVGRQMHRIFTPLSGNETFQIGYYGNTNNYDCESKFYQMLSAFKFIQ